MQRFDTNDLTGPADWSGPTYTGFGEAAVKLRWIKDAYQWHRNDGAEVFLVLDGAVDMHVRRAGDSEATIERLGPGQMLLIEDGEEHIAYPLGEARVLVVERVEAQ
jgi:mannose-6-phosphate isomerase-like protein (cupin superfamily)